jgi:hypothetical protein
MTARAGAATITDAGDGATACVVASPRTGDRTASPLTAPFMGATSSTTRSSSRTAASPFTAVPSSMRGRIASGSSAIPKRSRRVAATDQETRSASSPGWRRMRRRPRPVSFASTTDASATPGTERMARSTSE